MSSPPSAPDGSLDIVTLVDLPSQCTANLSESPFGPFQVRRVATPEEALTASADSATCVALIVAGHDVPLLAVAATSDVAVLVVVPEVDLAGVLKWLQSGAEDVFLASEMQTSTFPLRLRAAIERKRLERDARTAYATDLETGLPHQQQFIEHMSQLLALREREPAPMAVLAWRIEGLAQAELRLGHEAANVLRRKIGVRLRAGVRASDVVAALGDDSFAVLLGSILAPTDAMHVGAKLSQALAAPFKIAGQEVTIAPALGVSQFPQDGAQPDALLRRAVGLAAAAQAHGRVGFSAFGDVASTAGAANDD